MEERSIWIGYDHREDDAFRVLHRSIRMRCAAPIPISPIVQADLRKMGIYRRSEMMRGNQRWDLVSDAPMSTEFACSRFFTPYLAGMRGWALFMDCDFLARADIEQLFAEADPRFAVQVVKHPPMIGQGLKMDGQAQTQYRRKNWSSLMLFNCRHPSNLALCPAMINELPGRDLHSFCWLQDHEIGSLSPDWNHLVGISPPNPVARMIHFTLGIPRMAGYENSEHAAEWFAYRGLCAA